MSAKDSITGGLGLEEACFEQLKEISRKKFSENNTISDALEAIAEDVRDNTLGEANLRVSQYEKKLILAGYISGLIKSEGKMKELKMITSLLLAYFELYKSGRNKTRLEGNHSCIHPLYCLVVL